jgi:small-conductance mechanosensitive channel
LQWRSHVCKKKLCVILQDQIVYTAQHCAALAVSCSCKQFKHALQGSGTSQKVVKSGVDAEDTAEYPSQEHGSELDQLSHTQAALKQAMQQLDVLTSSDDDMHNVRTQLKQQTQALQSMQESIATAEEEKARDHEQALSRSISDHTHGELPSCQIACWQCLCLSI